MEPKLERWDGYAPIITGMEKVELSAEMAEKFDHILHQGVVAYTVNISWGSGDGAHQGTYMFVGTMFGAPGPVFLMYPDQPDMTPIDVVAPERFGVRFNDDWVRGFYS